MRRIDRYFLREMITPALVGFLMMLVLLIGNKLYMLLMYLYNGAPLGDVGAILLYSIPEILLLAVPASLMLGTALAVTRLERDRELLALRMAGVRLLRLMSPYLLVGILSSVGLWYLQERVVPHTSHIALKLFNKFAFSTPTAVMPPSNDIVMRLDQTIVYIRQVDPNTQTLRGILAFKREPATMKDPATLRVVSVPLAINNKGHWELKPDPFTGEMPSFFIYNAQGKPLWSGNADTGMLNLRADAWDYLASDNVTRPEELTFQQLVSLRRDMRIGGNFSTYGLSFVPEPKQLDFYLHRKIAVPLSALVAILIAIPLSVHFGRNGGYVGLLLSMVLAFCFMVSQQWTQVLAIKGLLNPVIAAWIPNLVFGLIGTVLLLREE